MNKQITDAIDKEIERIGSLNPDSRYKQTLQRARKTISQSLVTSKKELLELHGIGPRIASLADHLFEPEQKRKREYVPPLGSPSYALTLGLLEIGQMDLNAAFDHCSQYVSPRSMDVSLFEWNDAKTQLVQNNIATVNDGKIKLTEFGEKLAERIYLCVTRIGSIEKPLTKSYSTGTIKSKPLSTESYLDEFEIKLLIDNREHVHSDRDFFQKHLRERGINCETMTLAVGDFLWIAQKRDVSVVLDVVCERKRTDDLAASIRDNRWRDQLSRLTKSGCHVFYLVEELNAFCVDFQGLLSAQVQSMLHGCHVVHLKNTQETINFLEQTHKLIQKKFFNKRLLYSTKKQQNVHQTLKSFQLELMKPQTQTLQTLFTKMLMAIHGVSIDKARVLSKKYKTISEFYYSLITDDTPSLTLEKLTESEIGRRKLGPNISMRISDLMTLSNY